MLLLALAALLVTASADASTTIWIKYQDLPRRARETVDKERRHYEVKQILEMRADGKTTFRVLIDEKGTDRAIFVSEGGKLLKEQEVPDAGGVGGGSYEKWIKYNDLPKEVRKTLDKERGHHEVRQINFVRRDNREFYRCIVDLKGDDLAVRINPVGKLLSFQEVDDVAIGSRETARQDYARERAVKYDDLPRDVRRTLDRERDKWAVKQIVFVERNGRRFYRCIIDSRPGDRVFRIAEDGYLYADNEVPDIAVGPGGYNANRYGHEARMKYADLPWAVKNTLDRERKGRDVKEILYVRRYNHTFYRCLIDTRGDDTAVRIADDGRLFSRQDVNDTAYGQGEVDDFAAREEWVKYASLPDRARSALDRARRGQDVLKIVRVDLRGRTTYRCLIDTRPWPNTVRITEDGRIID
jgi:hypothetical protein